MLLAGMQGPPALCSGHAVQKMDSYVSQILQGDSIDMHWIILLYPPWKIFKRHYTAPTCLLKF